MRLCNCGQRNIKKPTQLSDTALAIIGLLNMGVQDVEKIAHLLDIERPDRKRQLGRLVKLLRTTEQKFLRQWVDCGLPAGECVPLPRTNKVLCPLCRNWVTTVPCLACSLKEIAHESKQRN